MRGKPSTEGAESGRRRGPGRPRIARYDDDILDSTLQVLFDRGYAGLTIDGVAAKAGVGRPTIYRRWPSKPALVIAALVRSTGLTPVPDKGSVREDLIAYQRDQVALMSAPESRRITAGLVADLVADPELSEVYLDQYVRPRRESVWRALQRGIDRGEIRPDVDFALVSDLLTGPLFIRSVVFDDPLGPDLVEKTVDVVLAAFAAPSRSGGATRTTRR